MTLDTTSTTVGLRFRRGQARQLESLAERMRQVPAVRDQIGMVLNAADSARTGEPLLVEVLDASEAILMAEWFVLMGCARPAIEAVAQSA